MFETFYPGNYVDSAYEIPYEKLYERGYRGIIFDVDNTLVPHGAPADKQAIELFERLRAIGFSTCILSNNKEPRVSPFADKVGSPYIFKGGKPSRKGYERAMERMKTDRDTTFFGRRPAVYGRLGRKQDRPLFDPCKAHQSKRRDPDCPETVSRGGSSHVLQETIEKTGRTAGDFCKK